VIEIQEIIIDGSEPHAEAELTLFGAGRGGVPGSRGDG